MNQQFARKLFYLALAIAPIAFAADNTKAPTNGDPSAQASQIPAERVAEKEALKREFNEEVEKQPAKEVVMDRPRAILMAPINR